MQIALISDIHGNLFALDAILNDIAQRNIEHILCLGDVAAGGPQPCEVIGRLREMGCPIVMGNTDAWLQQPQLHPQKSVEGQFAQDIEFCPPDNWSKTTRLFCTLLQQNIYAWSLNAHMTLLGYHGSPRSFSERLLPTTPDQTLDDALAASNAQIFAGGHTHIQMFRRYKEKLIINPGSVGLAMDRTTPFNEVRNTPWGEYAVLTCGDKNMSSVELCRSAVRHRRLPCMHRSEQDATCRLGYRSLE